MCFPQGTATAEVEVEAVEQLANQLEVKEIQYVLLIILY